MTGLDFVFLSHCVSMYGDCTGIFVQVPGVSVQVPCKFQALQRIRVVDFLTTHPCCRRSRRNSWILYQVYPCCRFLTTHPCCRFLCNTDASSISSMRTLLVLRLRKLMTQTARCPSVVWHTRGQALGQGKAGATPKNDIHLP
jgi:hypothetical protein